MILQHTVLVCLSKSGGGRAPAVILQHSVLICLSKSGAGRAPAVILQNPVLICLSKSGAGRNSTAPCFDVFVKEWSLQGPRSAKPDLLSVYVYTLS